ASGTPRNAGSGRRTPHTRPRTRSRQRHRHLSTGADLSEKRRYHARPRTLRQGRQSQGRRSRAIYPGWTPAHYSGRLTVTRWARVIAAGLMTAALRAQTPDFEAARAHDARGVTLAEAGKTADALQEFREALRAAPAFPDAH